MSLIERLKNPENYYEFTDPKKANAALMSLCQEAADALSAPVQEPENEPFVSLASVQEPVRGWWAHTSPITGITDVQDWQLTEDDKARGWIEREIYTTPPAAQRQWVGLNQDELDAMFRNTIKGKKLVNWVAKAIEAKLKEKNNG